ncbi:MAG: hypothetical protein A2Y38_15495 [Spirochaetes bacterium GWB1_59_5]|nr:MAG: hypothetical protein A2Y38_15495 [Spirochaetes bacterium GWB1_59_5]
MSTKKWTPRLCPECEKEWLPKGHRTCSPCQEKKRIANNKKHCALAKQERERQREGIGCRCGCGRMVARLNTYADECRAAAKKATYARQLQRQQDQRTKKIADSAPPEPKRPVMTDEEQAAINKAEAERTAAAFAEWIRETMGLITGKGKPLASPVRHLPPVEIAELSQKYQPPKGRTVNPYSPMCC